MRIIARLLLTTLLALTAGCAQKDWIDRTLVTVDVTGTWYGKSVGAAYGPPDFLFELRQQGGTVKGAMRFVPGGYREIDGTVAGDVLRFKDSRGSVKGEFTVSEDEMSGQVMIPPIGTRPISLRRVDPSAPPASPPR